MHVVKVRQILDRINYRPEYEFLTHTPAATMQTEALQVRFWRVDRETGREGWGYSRCYGITPDVTPAGIVTTVFAALRDLTEHELREQFTVDGIQVLGPHFDLERLLEVHRRER
jgi:hypothetical protein